MLAERSDAFHPDNPGRAHFTELADASLNIAITYWFTPPDDWAAYLDFTHQFNIDLLTRFNAESIEFAFPTQTLYLKKDAPEAQTV